MTTEYRYVSAPNDNFPNSLLPNANLLAQLKASQQGPYAPGSQNGCTSPSAPPHDANSSRINQLVAVIHYHDEAGQSNGNGSDGNRFLDTEQPFNNLMLGDTSGDLATLGDNLHFDALKVPMRSVAGGAYPSNIGGQNAGTSMANELSHINSRAYQVYLACVAQGGVGIDVIRKNGSGTSWAASEFEFAAAIAIAARSGRKVVHDGVLLILGENDNNNPQYLAKLIQYGYDYQERRLTNGQSEPINIVSFQQHTFAPDGVFMALSARAELEAHKQSPYHFLAGPRYQYTYLPISAGGTSVHHDSFGFRRLGIKAAQVKHLINVCGVKWNPCRPKAISHNVTTGVVKVDLYVPFGALRFDEDCPPPVLINNGQSNFWLKGRGFEVEGELLQSEGRVTISGSSILIQLTPGRPIYDGRLRYANRCNQTGGYVYGDRSAGRCGSVCDSDPHVGYDAEYLVCNVTNGSTTITIADNGFFNRGQYDRVSGSALIPFTIIKTKANDVSLVLSKPWTGATGTAKLKFWHDQSNYLVAFDLPVPYSE